MIENIYLEDNAVNMIGPYDHAEPLASLIIKLEEERKFVRAGGQTIANTMIVSKGITLLAQT